MSRKNVNNQESNIETPAFIDASGRYIDPSSYSFLSFRLPALDFILQEAIEKEEKFLLLVPAGNGIGNIYLEKIDNAGLAWKIKQEKTAHNKKTTYPIIRFFYNPKNGAIKPIDYTDELIQLEAKNKTSQLLIASFMAYWLTALMALHNFRETFLHPQEEQE